MLTVELMGGLGNQLFQIFALLNCAFDSKKEFIFEKGFKMPGSRQVTYWDNLFKNISKHTIAKKINFQIYREKAHSYNPLSLIPAQYNVKLYGYFQSYKYFTKYEKQILEMLRFNDFQDALKMKRKDNYENCISLHFRLGDYLHLQEYHAVLNISYYEKALKYLLARFEEKKLLKGEDGVYLPEWKVLYCCEEEDIEHVKKNIALLRKSLPKEIVFERIENKYADWEQMLIMSLCAHNIIANSTFSWWSAYLNRNKDKMVCYPNIYFGPKLAHEDISDLYPEGWEIIIT